MAVRKGAAGRRKTKAPAKTSARSSAAKKKKAAPNKAGAKKTAGRKSAATKRATRKVSKKAAAKKGARKAAPRKVAAKTRAASKKAAKKTAPKKAAAKTSPVSRKPAAKSAKKTIARKAAPKVKKPVAAVAVATPVVPARKALRKSARRSAVHRVPTPRDKPARKVGIRTAVVKETSRRPGAKLQGAVVTAPGAPRQDEVLTPEVLALVGAMHRQFDGRRLSLIARRHERQARFDAGERPEPLHETRQLRTGDWKIDGLPVSLGDRFADMACVDFEDGLSPTWKNLIDGQLKLLDGATPFVIRPRGWHLPEAHVSVEGTEVSAALFDVAAALSILAPRMTETGGPVIFELPKLESHLEAKLWSDVLSFAERRLKLTRGAVKVVALIETVTAAVELDEIISDLRDSIVALRFDPVDYLFSHLKRLGARVEASAGGAAALAAAREAVGAAADRRGLLAFGLTGEPPTPATFAEAIDLSLYYLRHWLGGRGLLEWGGRTITAADAELARTLVWSWLRHGLTPAEGTAATPAEVGDMITSASVAAGIADRPDISELFRDSVTAADCDEHLILLAYRSLLRPS